MRRFLSHNVIINGTRRSGLSLVTINDDKTIEVTDFTVETADTAFVDGDIIIDGAELSIITRTEANDCYRLSSLQQK